MDTRPSCGPNAKVSGARKARVPSELSRMSWGEGATAHARGVGGSTGRALAGWHAPEGAMADARGVGASTAAWQGPARTPADQLGSDG